MEKVDFKKTLKSLCNPPVNEFVENEKPQMQFVKVDGAGDPNNAFAIVLLSNGSMASVTQ